MPSLSPWRLIWKRNTSGWKLVASIAIGVLLATTVVAGTPIYLSALEKLGVKKAVDTRSKASLDITVYMPYLILDRAHVDNAELVMENGINAHVARLVLQRERLMKGPSLLSAIPGQDIPQIPSPTPPSKGYLQQLTNVEKHLTVKDGRFPSDRITQSPRGPVVEAALGSSTADYFSLAVGDVVTLAPSRDARNRVYARITALVVATDPQEEYWQGNASGILSPPPEQPAGGDANAENEAPPPIALLVTEDALINSLSQAYPSTVVSALWFLFVNGDVVKNTPTAQTLKNLNNFESEITRNVSEAGVFTGITPMVEELNNRLFFSSVPFYLLMALILSVVLFYLAMMIGHLVARQEPEVALLQSRGVGLIQLLRLYTFEGLLIVAVAVVLSPLLAAGSIALLGKLPYFSDLTGGDFLSSGLGLVPFIASSGAGLLCLVILVVPRVVGSRSGLVSHKLRTSRPPSTPIFQRYFLDVGVLVVGGLIFWELKTRGSLLSGGLFDSPHISEALLFAPILFLVSVTIIFMRLFPLVIRLFSKLIATRSPVWATLSLWHMSRNPFRYTWLVLLLVLITGLGILATTLGGTLKRSYEERVFYDTATDLRIDRLPSNINTGRSQLKELLQTIPGASTVSMGFRGTGRFGVTSSGAEFTMFAVETRQFPYISWYRKDFSESSLQSLMRTVGSVEKMPPLELPAGTKRVGLWVNPGAVYPNMFLWLAFRDADSTIHTVSLGPVGKPAWHYLEEDLPNYAKPPLTLEAVEIYEPVYGPTGTPGYFYMDDIQVVVEGETSARVLEGFEKIENWTPLATSALSSDDFGLVTDEVKEGQAAALFKWGKDTNQGIRGVYRSPSGGPLPVVASKSFLATTGRNISDTMILSVFERFVPVVIRDVVDYFPTLDPQGTGFVIADIDLLLNHLNLLSPLTAISPNELFISTTGSSHEIAVAVAQSFVRSESQIHDEQQQLETIKEDPLLAGGWRILVFLSIGTIILTMTLGYMTFLLASAMSNKVELGVLQAVGLSKRQIISMLAVEHFSVVILGLSAGTWAGIEMSRLSVASVSQTEAGRPILPPFVLVTEWNVMLMVYAILAAVALVSFYALSRSVARMDLNTITKLED